MCPKKRKKSEKGNDQELNVPEKEKEEREGEQSGTECALKRERRARRGTIRS